MIFHNNFIIDPEQFRTPQYNISPFGTEWMAANHAVLNAPFTDNGSNILQRCFGGQHYFTDSGKSAVSLILAQYRLQPGDEVFIATTTGNTYVSGCVTREIEKYCKWSRKLTPNTRLIFVNHEFGTTYAGMDKLLQTGLPVIEDRAMSMFSTDDAGRTGRYGDFTVYSLPKFFPVQAGGVIQVNNPAAQTAPFPEETALAAACRKLAVHYISGAADIAAARWQNYRAYEAQLGRAGFAPALSLEEGLHVPSVYMFKAPNADLAGLKTFMQQNGVECSVFYGQAAFFVPVHQCLKPEDISFIVSLIQFYCNEVK